MRMHVSALLAVVSLILTGCASFNSDPLFQPHHVTYQDEAASVDVATTMLAPWSDYSSILQPQFTLSATDALAKVLPTTENLDQRITNILAGSLALGIPQSGQTSQITTTIPASGSATTQGTQTNTLANGAVPSVQPGNPNVTPAAATLASGLVASRPTAIDPILAYSSAAALYQEVALLNQSVRSAALRHGYVPYIGRTQISVRPNARNLPYDLHLTISFFTGDGLSKPDGYPIDGPQQPPYVLPILVTDDLEGVAHARTVDQIRQLDLAISGLVNGLGIGAAGRSGKDNWQNVLGTDLNGLITVGRATDNAIAVRLGAAAQPNPGFGMVARNYNISFVLLVPEEYLRKFPKLGKSDCAIPAPDVVASPTHCDVDRRPTVGVLVQTVMRETTTGAILPARPRSEFQAFMRDALNNTPAYQNLDDETISTLVGFVQTGDMNSFVCVAATRNATARMQEDGHCSAVSQASKNIAPDSKTIREVAESAPLAWTAISTVLARTPFHGASLHLPYEPKPSVDESQIVLLNISNGKIIVRVADITGFDPLAYVAALSGPGGKIYADSLALDPIAHTLTVTFPLVGTEGGKPVDLKALTELVLKPADTAVWRLNAHDDDLKPVLFRFSKFGTVTTDVAFAKAPTASFNISLGADTLLPAAGGTATLRLFLSSSKADQVKVSLMNASLVSVSAVGTGGTGKIDSGNLILTGSKGAYDLSLQGLVSGHNVTITAEGSKADAPAFRNVYSVGVAALPPSVK